MHEETIPNLTYRISGNQQRLDLEGAAAVLDALAKPVTISGSLSGTIVEVSAAHNAKAGNLRGIVWMLESALHDALGRFPTDDATILCLGAGRRLRITLRDFRNYNQNFVVDGSGGIGMFYGERASELGLSLADLAGAVLVLRFTPGGTLRVWEGPSVNFPPSPN